MFATAIRRRPSTVEYGTLFQCRHNTTDRSVKVGHRIIFLASQNILPRYLSALVCMILRVAILVELRLVTDGQTDGHRHRAGTALHSKSGV